MIPWKGVDHMKQRSTLWQWAWYVFFSKKKAAGFLSKLRWNKPPPLKNMFFLVFWWSWNGQVCSVVKDSVGPLNWQLFEQKWRQGDRPGNGAIGAKQKWPPIGTRTMQQFHQGCVPCDNLTGKWWWKTTSRSWCCFTQFNLFSDDHCTYSKTSRTMMVGDDDKHMALIQTNASFGT